jgi:hypothetical protein
MAKAKAIRAPAESFDNPKPRQPKFGPGAYQ